ncbi:hypothetical protein CN575_00110 [Bacillus wiedmannii]|uniref:DNA mismatch repair protein MutT n=2 Tax=Bacillus cereus group TaxID=86661 RepID=A0A2C5GK56_9BACI|nr:MULTISPECIES: hypothetical protein [Bacillus]AZJ21568.1 hypothetical protein CT694_18740 [Bacillus wiedmannii bv. thuringiensis]MCC2324732.1 hypothetical protein [Bacillus wiedmannii]MCU5098461.1 hypothetical protein [Bacillus wiedmannii]MCU5326927.1 hypothetical protein [Bacillus wiedmannii]MCU5683797.1 hypothetical protein [Bacillus wiedmannii]
MFKKIIVSSMALTMLGGAATMLETPTAQAASYNSTSASYFDVTPEEAAAFYQSQDYKKLKDFMDDFEARNPYVPGGGYAQGSVRMQKFNDALRAAKLTNVYQEFIRISYYNHYPEPK